MIEIKTQQTKARLFHRLHHNGGMLVLPNIWDPLGAALLENLEYPAIATASASIAFANGYDDGENMPFNALLLLLHKIVASVNIPVTADIESGYSDTDEELRENIKMLIGTGIAGINIEDYDKKSNALFPVEIQCKRIGLIRKVSGDMDMPLFINARSDVYIKEPGLVTDEEKFEEIVKRGTAYMKAGADCFFPVGMKQEQDIQHLIAELQSPVNILAIPGMPDLKTLHSIGVARVSLGPSFLKIAVQAMKDIAIKLRNLECINEVTGNGITSDYLKGLVRKK